MAKRGRSRSGPKAPQQLEKRVARLERGYEQVIEVREAFFSGPLPPPEILRDYEDACPGCAERILAMAEAQSTHRRRLEVGHQKGAGQREWAGMIFGFVLALTAILGGIYLITNGFEIGGLASIIAALASLVGVFIYARRTKTKELARKWRQMLGRETNGAEEEEEPRKLSS